MIPSPYDGYPSDWREDMDKAPKGRCPSCDKNLTLDLKGQKWVVPSHNLSRPGPNPECPGTGKAPR